MLALRKRLSYKQAKWALLLLLLLSLLMSVFQIVADWHEEKQTIQKQVLSTLQIVKDSATEAAYSLDEDLAKKVLTGLMKSNNFHTARLDDDLGNELASAFQPLPAVFLRGLSSQLFSDLPSNFTLSLYRDAYFQVGMLTVTIDRVALANGFLRRNVRLLLTSLFSALLLGAAMLMLFYV